jgi:hypothetical protein
MTPDIRALTCLALAAGGLLYCVPATAGPGAALEQQVEQLRREVHDLETRIRQLERGLRPGMPADQAAPGVPAAPAADSPLDPALQSLGRLRDAWQGIATGMNETQVRAQLGEPARRFTIDGKPVWYYSYPGVGNGSVMFSATGKVVGTQHPPFRFW